MNLIVRVAQQKDLADLVEVISSSFHAGSGMMRWFLPILRMGVYEDLRQRLRSSSPQDYVCFVAVVVASGHPPNSGAQRLAGTVEVTFRSTQPFQLRTLPYPYLSNLAVRVECRRQGVAQRLLAASEKAVLDWGAQDIYLHVLEDNHQARRLYLKAGYKLQKADPFWRCWLLKQPRRLLLHKQLTLDVPASL